MYALSYIYICCEGSMLTFIVSILHNMKEALF